MMAFGIQEELNCSSYKGPVQALEEFHSLHWATRPIRLKKRHLQVFKEKKVYKWRDRQPHDDSQFFVLGKGRVQEAIWALDQLQWLLGNYVQNTANRNISQMAHMEAISNSSLSLYLCVWCFLWNQHINIVFLILTLWDTSDLLHSPHTPLWSAQSKEHCWPSLAPISGEEGKRWNCSTQRLANLTSLKLCKTSFYGPATRETTDMHVYGKEYLIKLDRTWKCSKTLNCLNFVLNVAFGCRSPVRTPDKQHHHSSSKISLMIGLKALSLMSCGNPVQCSKKYRLKSTCQRRKLQG